MAGVAALLFLFSWFTLSLHTLCALNGRIKKLAREDEGEVQQKSPKNQFQFFHVLCFCFLWFLLVVSLFACLHNTLLFFSVLNSTAVDFKNCKSINIIGSILVLRSPRFRSVDLRDVYQCWKTHSEELSRCPERKGRSHDFCSHQPLATGAEIRPKKEQESGVFALLFLFMFWCFSRWMFTRCFFLLEIRGILRWSEKT